MSVTERAETGPKRLHVITWGCQMNVYDSARMADVLAPLGYAPVSAPDGADMVILNTCHIRDKAAEKVFSELGKIRRLKAAKARDGGTMLIAVAGCVAQAEGEEILRRAPFVDIVFGPQTYHRLPEMIARATRAAGGGILDTSFPAEPKFDHLPEIAAAPGVSAFLSILPFSVSGSRSRQWKAEGTMYAGSDSASLSRMAAESSGPSAV